ncbi:TfoX/Sxy family DNA transformation protein [Thalassolituus sp. LLYu03]|uniref:TfoX/Sxy family DNA transformation protein n=1 Tax=Thalassolituus sp. LLYu03 TaxID=3421656 RepID=UPI003D28331D
MSTERRIRDLRGLGPKSEAMLATIGVSSVDAFLQSDPFELYQRLKKPLPGLSLNLLYAMLAAQEDLPWQQIARERRTEILLRLDDMGLAP